MPRTTRAAQRAAILEDAVEAADVPLPATPTRAERAPLGEISANRQDEHSIVLEVSLDKPLKEGTAKKKASGCKKPKKANLKKENNLPEVVEDDCQSSASSAVAEACQQLSRRSSQGSGNPFIALTFRNIDQQLPCRFSRTNAGLSARYSYVQSSSSHAQAALAKVSNPSL